ncbi:hypothetical protein ACVWYH_001569 [Bradyrhizobium sp. GM24.11]
MSRKLLLLATITLTALGGLSNAPAFAQGHMGTPQEQNACSRDASRLCRKDLGNDNAVARLPASPSCEAVEVMQQGVPEPRHVRSASHFA